MHVSDQSTSDSGTESDEASGDSDSVASAEFNMSMSCMSNALIAPTTRPLSPSDSESGDESFSLSTDDDEPASGDHSPNMALCPPIILSEQRGDAEGHSEEVELHFRGVPSFGPIIHKPVPRLLLQFLP